MAETPVMQVLSCNREEKKRLHMNSKFKSSMRKHHQISTVHNDYNRVISIAIIRERKLNKLMH